MHIQMREFFMNIKDNAAQVRPAYATIDDWMMISGMGRRAVYGRARAGQSSRRQTRRADPGRRRPRPRVAAILATGKNSRPSFAASGGAADQCRCLIFKNENAPPGKATRSKILTNSNSASTIAIRIARRKERSAMSDDFNWSIAEEEAVLREQPQTAVYLNAHGDLVIRQRGDSYEDDPYILIAIHNVARVARAMLEMAGLEIIP